MFSPLPGCLRLLHPAVLYLRLYWPEPFYYSFCFNSMFFLPIRGGSCPSGGCYFFFFRFICLKIVFAAQEEDSLHQGYACK